MKRGAIELMLVFLAFSLNAYSQGSTLGGAKTYFIKALNSYRTKHNVGPVKESDKLWQWCYDQSFYEAYLHKMLQEQGVFEYRGGHSQDTDIPNWEEQDRTQIPLKIRPLVRENVAVYWVEKTLPGVASWKDEADIARSFLNAWAASPGHNETLLDPECIVISICFYRTDPFVVKKNGKKTSIVVIAATLNMGVF